MLDLALPQGALPQVVDAVLSRRHLRGLQVRHVSVSGYALRAAAYCCMLGEYALIPWPPPQGGMAAHTYAIGSRCRVALTDRRFVAFDVIAYYAFAWCNKVER